jgi:hypothetical protein
MSRIIVAIPRVRSFQRVLIHRKTKRSRMVVNVLTAWIVAYRARHALRFGRCLDSACKVEDIAADPLGCEVAYGENCSLTDR